MLFHLLLQDGKTTTSRRGGGGWDGIDPLPELPLFHATAEDSFGGSLYIFGEPAIFWLEGWRASMRYHRGDDEAPVQEAPVLARFRSFLVRYYGEN